MATTGRVRFPIGVVVATLIDFEWAPIALLFLQFAMRGREPVDHASARGGLRNPQKRHQ